MSTKLSESALAEIRQRRAAINEAKWTASQTPNDGRWAVLGPSFELSLFSKAPLTTKERAEFIAHSLTDIPALLDHIAALEEELKRFEYPCGGCGGPHEYDTSVPSPLWNRVVREQGLSDYLCASCIVKVFARARTSFTAELYGPELDGDEVPTISVQVNGIPIDDSYGDLQFRLRELESELKAARQEFEQKEFGWEMSLADLRSRAVNNFRAQLVEAVRVKYLENRIILHTTRMEDVLELIQTFEPEKWV